MDETLLEIDSPIYASLIYRPDEENPITRTIASGVIIGVGKAKKGDPDFKEGETVYSVRFPYLDKKNLDIGQECEAVIHLAGNSLFHSYGQVSDAVGFAKPPHPLMRRGSEYIRRIECQSAGPFRMKNPQSTKTLRAPAPA